ncbi:MAG: BrnA antitoxin family protein [Pseudomonadota bacterium]
MLAAGDAPASATGSARARGVRAEAKALKQIVTIRLDIDMLEWFKQQGPGYQTRINQLLREHMDENNKRSPAK